MDAEKVFYLSCIKYFLQKKSRNRRLNRYLMIQLQAMQCVELFQLHHFRRLQELQVILPLPRRYWMTNYDQGWFERFWYGRNDNIIRELWVKEFRMLPETFEHILNIVRPSLAKENTRFRECIPIEKKVAISIWSLATGHSYRAVSRVFNVSKASAVETFLAFIRELCNHGDQIIHFYRDSVETTFGIQQFKAFTGCNIQQVAGVLDCTHVEVRGPDSDSKFDYYSRKQKCTVNTQAVVGANLIFLDISTGYPGSAHDARVLRHSNLHTRAENGEILSAPIKYIEDIGVKPILHPCDG